jgi:uncharacterized membrane protein YfcA
LGVTPTTLPFLVLAGGLSGFVNTVAGGGSLFTFPLLILLGFPPQLANGTNRVSILMQNLVAVPTYAKQGYFFPKQALALGAAAVPAAFLGAATAARLDPEPFRKIAALLLLAVLTTLFLKPTAWTRDRSRDRIRWKGAIPLMIAVGFYGGFFQIGTGMPLLAVIVLVGGWDLVSANSLKVEVVLLFTTMAVIVFALHDQIDWPAGAALGVGNMAGAWIGAHSAVKRGPGWIRWVLITMATLAALKMVFGGGV